mgnify:CR=1 FL=1
MGLHRCSEADCCYTGQPSPTSCGCHQADEQVLRTMIGELVIGLCQYRDDLRYPRAPDSIERRLAMIEKLMAKAEGVS